MSLEKRIGQNLASVRSRMAAAAERAGRDVATVTLVAVTKSVGLDEISVLRDLGLRHFAENRVAVAREKIEHFSDPALTWHMVGTLQRRKVGDVVRLFDRIDSIDRIAAADALEKCCKAEDIACHGLIEVNVSGEAQKHGFSAVELESALTHVATLERVKVDGLLTMAPANAEGPELRSVFDELRRLADGFGLPSVSMGMSDDFEVAIEAGATEVRIGRTLFR